MEDVCQFSYVPTHQPDLRTYFDKHRSVLKHTLVDPFAGTPAQQYGVSDVPPGEIHLYSTLCCSCV
jgi:hypothetical protein